MKAGLDQRETRFQRRSMLDPRSGTQGMAGLIQG